MNKIPVIGGIKAEIKIEMEDNVVEINTDDIINSDSDNDGDHFDNNEEENIIQDIEHAKVREIKEKNKDHLVIVTEVQQNNKNDKCSKDFKPQDSEQLQEKLVLNYNIKNKDVHNDSQKEKLEEMNTVNECTKKLHQRNTVNECTSWSNLYPTSEATSVQEDMLKVKVTRVPTSFVDATEYTKEAINRFRCNHCKFFTTNRKYCKKHIRQQHRDITKTYSCPYCPVVAKHSLKTHIISMHKSESELKWFRCNQCDFKSKLKTTLTNHLLSHLDPSQMLDRMKKCDRCPKMYKNGSALKRHKLLIHERHAVNKRKCTQCNYECVLITQLNRHMEVYHSNLEDLESHKCPKCSYKTQSKYKYNEHIKTTHSAKLFQCEKCSYRTNAMDKLKLHLINHKETKDEADLKYRCDKCDYKTYRTYSLQIHKLNHLKPEEINFFYCYHCNFKAKRKDNLKTHVLRHFKHNEVPFACYICDFTTTKRHLLINHIDKHSKQTRNKLKNEEEAENATAGGVGAKKRERRTAKHLAETKSEIKNEEEMENTTTDLAAAEERESIRSNKVIVPTTRRSERNKNKTRKCISPTIKQSKELDTLKTEVDTPVVKELEEVKHTKQETPKPEL